jgi:hypothetical protein
MEAAELSKVVSGYARAVETVDLAERKEPLPIVGPSGNQAAPSFSTFLSRLFDEKTGAFQVMGPVLGAPLAPAGGGTGVIGGRPGGVRLDVGVVDVTKADPSTVFDRQGLTVTALGIPHGDMPGVPRANPECVDCLQLRSDRHQSGICQVREGSERLDHASCHCGRRQKVPCTSRQRPWVASLQEAGVGRLIVSHIGEFDLDAAIAELKQFYSGPLTIGAAMQCTPVQ